MGAAWFAAVAALVPGGVAEPVLLPGGFHLLVLRRHEPKAYHAFADVRDTVETHFRRDAQARAEEELVASLRQKAEVLVVPDSRP